eukprot:7364598-Ditylum_brightwellii.AAC.1
MMCKVMIDMAWARESPMFCSKSTMMHKNDKRGSYNFSSSSSKNEISIEMMKSDHNSNRSNHASTSTGRADSKILTDLTTLSDQIKLYQTMLGSTPPSQCQHNKALLVVVGFLEACMPKMVELVDVAAQGALLQESTLE